MLYRLLRLKQRASAAGRRSAAEGPLRLLARPRAAVPRHRGDGRASSRSIPDWGMPFGLPGALRARVRHAHALDRGRRAVPRAARRCRRPTPQRVADWEALPQRRQPEGAADEPLHLRALVHRAPVLRRPARRGVFRAGALEDSARASRSTSSPRAGPTTTRACARVYYRLRRIAETPLAKTHMPYALNAARMARLKAWFLDAPYEVTRPALVRAGGRVQSLRHLPAAPGRTRATA